MHVQHKTFYGKIDLHHHQKHWAENNQKYKGVKWCNNRQGVREICGFMKLVLY